MSDRDRLLAVATPEEWDCLMTFCADYLVVPYTFRPNVPEKYRRMDKVFGEVLGRFDINITSKECTDEAIARLERAGVFTGY